MSGEEQVLIRVPYTALYGHDYPYMCVISDKLSITLTTINELVVDLIDSIIGEGGKIDIWNGCDLAEALLESWFQEDVDVPIEEESAEYSIFRNIILGAINKADTIRLMLPINIQHYEIRYIKTTDDDLILLATTRLVYE